jgi:hypothetical protein
MYDTILERPGEKNFFPHQAKVFEEKLGGGTTRGRFIRSAEDYLKVTDVTGAIRVALMRGLVDISGDAAYNVVTESKRDTVAVHVLIQQPTRYRYAIFRS